jgi:hypothetical protein
MRQQAIREDAMTSVKSRRYQPRVRSLATTSIIYLLSREAWPIAEGIERSLL